MSSAKHLLRYLAAVCVVALVFATSPGQPGQGMIHFPDPQMELENRVNQIETKQSISEQRQNAVTQSFSREMTTLTKDTGAIKTTVTRLVEDSVQMMGRIRILQDVGSDVVNLRRFVGNIQKDTDSKVSQIQTQVNSVSGKLEQLASANTYITVGLSTQMKQNKELLKALQSTVAQIDNKIRTAEQKIANLESSVASSSGETLAGTVAQLKEQLAAFERTQAEKMEHLEGLIAEAKGQR